MKWLTRISLAVLLLGIFLSSPGAVEAQCAGGADCGEDQYCAKTGYLETRCVSCNDTSYPALGFGCSEAGFPGAPRNLDKAAASGSGLVNLVDLVITFITAVIIVAGLIGLVIGSYVYITAGGSAERIGLAKTIIAAALVGIVLALLAQLILNALSPQFAEKAAEPKFGP